MSRPSLPKSVLFFGFMNALLGTIGVVSGISALISKHTTVAQTIYQQVDLPSQSAQWLQAAMVLSPISSAIMLFCGIGLLRRQPWGRTLAIYYGIGSIVFSLIASGINISRIADRSSNLIVLNIITSILVSVFLGLLYKAAMVYFLARPSVKVALAAAPVGAEILEFKSAKQKRRPRA
jgi:hypothetical protein